jgi:hypothetical protein
MLARLLGRRPVAKLVVLFYAGSWLVALYEDDFRRASLGSQLPPGARRLIGMLIVIAAARSAWLWLEGRARRASRPDAGDDRRRGEPPLVDAIPADSGRGGSLGRVALRVGGVLVAMHAAALLVQLLAAAGAFGGAWPASD